MSFTGYTVNVTAADSGRFIVKYGPELPRKRCLMPINDPRIASRIRNERHLK